MHYSENTTDNLFIKRYRPLYLMKLNLFSDSLLTEIPCILTVQILLVFYCCSCCFTEAGLNNIPLKARPGTV